MNAARYYLALFLTVTLPPLLCYWLLLHPFIRFWRRVGPVATYTVVTGLMLAGVIPLYGLRRALLTVEYGTQAPLVVAGLAGLAGAVRLRWMLSRHFGLRELVGLPEVAPERYPMRLVTEGIYARIRHPRYVELLLAFVSCALVANYLALYVAVALWFPGICLIARLEERELRRRFGQAYEAYCERVPRFVPRWRQGRG